MALSDWDKKHLNGAQQRAVLAYTEAWEKAKAAGDQDGMLKAHAGAESVRRAAGYSGGGDGSNFTAVNTKPTTTAKSSKGYDNGSLTATQIKTLQGALGVSQDGYFGPKTQAAAFQRWGTSSADEAMKLFQSATTPARTSFDFNQDEGTYSWNGQTFSSRADLTAAMNRANLSAAEKNIVERKAQNSGAGLKLSGGEFGSKASASTGNTVFKNPLAPGRNGSPSAALPLAAPGLAQKPAASAPVTPPHQVSIPAQFETITDQNVNGYLEWVQGQAMQNDWTSAQFDQALGKGKASGYRNPLAPGGPSPTSPAAQQRGTAEKPLYLAAPGIQNSADYLRSRLDQAAEKKKQEEKRAAELPALGERIGKTVLGGAQNYAAGIANAGAVLAQLGKGGVAIPAGSSPAIRNALQAQGQAVGDAQSKILYGAADTFSQRAAQNNARAQEGASKAGKVALDVIGQGTQMLGDAAIGIATGGSALIPMAARSFGSGAQEARHEGADVNRAALYGAANAAVEVLTEKMFDGLAGIYGKGGADEVVENVINKLTKNEAARRALNVAASAAGESLEEFVSGIANPALQTIYNGKRYNGVKQYLSELEASDILYDMLIGGIMGGLGGSVDAVRDAVRPLPTAEEYAAQRAAQRAATVTNGIQTGKLPPVANRAAETRISPRSVASTEAAQSARISVANQNAALESRTAGMPHMSMADFANIDSPVWNNVEYGDTDTQQRLLQAKHREMVDAGDVVAVPEAALNEVAQAYPDLRGMKKSERTPVLKQKINELKTTLRNMLNGLKGAYEFEVNGNILEARLYDTGVREVMQNITQPKAAMLTQSASIFQNAQYLYSTPDYEGNPNIYRWNYFYTPVQIGDQTVGVRIAVRDVVKGTDLHPESQIYNWGIKENAPLDDGRPGTNPNTTGASSGALSVDALDGGSRGPKVASPGASSAATVYENTIAQPSNAVKGDGVSDLGLGADGLGAADTGSVNTAYDNLQAQSDTFHPEGPSPVRHTDVPTTNFDGRNIPKSASTIYGAQGTPDAAVLQLEQLIADGTLAFDTITDKDAVASAQGTIQGKGFNGALEQYRNAASANVATKNNIALGEQLLLQSMREGNTAATAEILMLYSRNSTNIAQAMQAQSMFRKLSPEGQLVGLQKALDSFNEKHGTDIQMSEGDVDDFVNARSDAEREKVREKIYKEVAQQVPSTFKAKYDALRYLAMLGNPRTHIRNILGNTFFQIPVIVKNRAGAVGEVVANAVSGGKVERTKAALGANPFGSLAKEARADFEKVKDFLGQVNKFSEGKTTVSDIEENIPAFSNKNIIGRGLNFVSEGNGALLEAEDMAAKKFIYTQSLAGYLKANGVKSIAGLDSTEEGRQLLNRARNYAAQEAMRNTFNDRNQLSDFVASAGKLSRSNNKAAKAAGYVVEGALPFKRTPTNILVRAVEYSPAGAAGILQIVKGAKAGDSTAITTGIDRLAAGMTGTGLMALGAILAGAGYIRGGDDDDDKQAAFDDLRGHQNYSLELSDGTSITLDWLAPEAIPFFMGVELYNAYLDGGVSFDDLMKTFRNATAPMLEMSMLQGLNNTFENAAYAKNSGGSVMGSVLTSALTNYATQVLPTILGQAERTTETERKSTYTDKNSWMPSDWQYTLGKISQKIPGWDYNQIPYVDAWGRIEETGSLGERAANNFLNPAYLSKVSEDMVEDELQRLYDVTGEGGVLPQRADKSFKVDGQTKYLTKDEYVAYATEKGSRSLQLVSSLIGAEGYNSLDDSEKAKAVSELYAYVNAKAKEAVFGIPLNSTEAKIDDVIKAGIDPAEYFIYAAKLAALTPEEGKEDVSDMQKYREIAGMNLSDADKITAIGNIMGMELTTKDGNPSQYAKMLDILDGGLPLNQYLDIKEAGKVDNYMKLAGTGIDSQSAYDLTKAIDALKPLEGKEQVSDLQRYQAITKSDLSDEDHLRALSAVMQESVYNKVLTSYSFGVSPRVYIDFKSELPNYDADKNDSYTQQEVKAAIDGIAESLDYIQLGGRGPLTAAEKAVLWQLSDKRWKADKNPYSVSVGRKVYNALQNGVSAEEILGSLPESSAPTRGMAGSFPIGALPLAAPGLDGTTAGTTREWNHPDDTGPAFLVVDLENGTGRKTNITGVGKPVTKGGKIDGGPVGQNWHWENGERVPDAILQNPEPMSLEELTVRSLFPTYNPRSGGVSHGLMPLMDQVLASEAINKQSRAESSPNGALPLAAPGLNRQTAMRKVLPLAAP